MFFYLSKTVWFCLQPSSLLVLAVALAVWLIRRGRIEAGLRWLTGSLVGTLVIGLSPVADLITSPLEARFPRPVIDGQRIDGIIVLGGMEETAPGVRELMSLNDAAERMTEATVLARMHPEARLVFSGGSGALIDRTSGAERARAFFTAFGIEASRIVLEDTSRNTHENAVRSREALQPKPGQRWLLVTSAWHMPRAVGCFRQAGFDVVAWPVDYRTPVSLDMTHVFGSLPEGLGRFDAMAKEYIGLLVYRITGRTDVLFPGPR